MSAAKALSSAQGGARPDRPCEWMRAGLIRYRLCDHDGACETCPLDAAMRGVTGSPVDGDTDREADGSGEDEGRWSFPGDRRYHRGHLWLRQQGPGLLRCGVDAFVRLLFPSPSRLSLPSVGARLREGKVAIWIGTRRGPLVGLCAPRSGRVLRRNEAVQQDPLLVGRSPYQRGWLLELAGTLSPEASDLVSADTMRELAGRQRRLLIDDVHRELGRAQPALGPLAADGGELCCESMHEMEPAMLRRTIEKYLKIQ